MEHKIAALVGPRQARHPRKRLMSACIVGVASLLSASSAGAVTSANKVLRNCLIVSDLNPSYNAWVLDMSRNSQDAGARFHLWQNLNTNNQKFILAYRGKGLNGGTDWNISVQHSGQCMFTDYDRDRQPIVQMSCVVPMMTWNLVDIGNGKYYVRSGIDNKYVLDVERGETWNGNAVYLYRLHGGRNQQWRLEGCQNLWGNLVSPAG